MKKLLLALAVICCVSMTQARQYDNDDTIVVDNNSRHHHKNRSSCSTCHTGCKTGCSENLCDVITETKVVMDKCPYEVCKCETKYKDVPRTLTRKVCTGRAGDWRGAEPCNGKKCGRCSECHNRGHVIPDSEVAALEANSDKEMTAEEAPAQANKKSARQAKRDARKADKAANVA